LPNGKLQQPTRIPYQLWSSPDDGASWRRLAVPVSLPAYTPTRFRSDYGGTSGIFVSARPGQPWRICVANISAENPASNSLTCTTDGGYSWQPRPLLNLFPIADGLPSHGLPIGIADNGAFLVTAATAEDNGGSLLYTLFRLPAGADRWQPLGSLPQFFVMYCPGGGATLGTLWATSAPGINPDPRGRVYTADYNSSHKPLPKQDEDAPELDEAEVVERVALVAHDQAPEVAQPGEEALDLPATSEAAQRTAILRLGACAAAPVRRDHLDAQRHERLVEWVGVVGTIADEPLGQVGYEAGIEGGGDEGDFVRRSRGSTRGERKTSAVCHCHELRTFAPLGRSHTPAPFFATMNVPSMKHSERSSWPRSFRSRASASSTCSSVPSRTQRWKRRWQVWYGG
jgi:hypothetical protein